MGNCQSASARRRAALDGNDDLGKGGGGRGFPRPHAGGGSPGGNRRYIKKNGRKNAAGDGDNDDGDDDDDPKFLLDSWKAAATAAKDGKKVSALAIDATEATDATTDGEDQFLPGGGDDDATEATATLLTPDSAAAESAGGGVASIGGVASPAAASSAAAAAPHWILNNGGAERENGEEDGQQEARHQCGTYDESPPQAEEDYPSAGNGTALSPLQPRRPLVASPESLLRQSPSPSRRTKRQKQFLPLQQQQQHRRPGRALQARLQKARCLQLALSSPSLLPQHQLQQCDNDLSFSSSTSVGGDGGGEAEEKLEASMTDISTRSADGYGDDDPRVRANADFEAGFSTGTLWTEVEYGGEKVTAVALSRQQQQQPALPSEQGAAVSLSPLSPAPAMAASGGPPFYPLLLAVGTEEGQLRVSHVLQDPAHPLQRRKEEAHQQPEMARRLGPTAAWDLQSRIRSIDFSPDGQYVAVGGDDCCCTILKIHYNDRSVADDDVEYDAAAAEDDEDELNDISTACGKISLTLHAELPRVDRVYAVQFSPRNNDSGYLAVGGFDGTVAIYSSGGGSNEAFDPDSSGEYQLVEEVSRDGLVFCLDWSADGKYLAFGGSEKCCYIIHAEKSWSICKDIRRPGTVQAVKWYPTPHRSYLAVASSHDVAILECPSSSAFRAGGNATDPQCIVKHEIDWSNSGAAAASLRSPCRNKNGNLHSLLSKSSGAHKVQGICWSPNGTYLVVSSDQCKCTLFETKTFTQIHEIRRPAESVVWGEQRVLSGVPQRYLALGHDAKVVILKAGLEMNSGPGSVMGDDLSSSASSSSSSSSNRVDWTLKENVFMDVDEIADMSVSRIHGDSDNQTVIALAFSRGSKSRPSTFFAYSLDDGRLIVRSTIDWKIVAELLFQKPVKTISFSNGSRFLTVGSSDSRVYIVETSPTWTVVSRKDFFAPVNTVAFSKHNERIAVGVEDGVVTLLDTTDKNYDAVGEIDVSESGVSSLDWTSRNFAVGRNDGSVSVYDTNQVCSNFCVPLAELLHDGAVVGLAFGPSSRFLAVATDDGLAHVYSAKGGWVLCHQLTAKSGTFSSLSWNASGRFIALGSLDNKIQMVDTVFWAEVEELEHLASSSDESNPDSPSHGGAAVAFSQNGNMLAFTSKDEGLKVIDTNRWKVSFQLNQSNEELLERSMMSM